MNKSTLVSFALFLFGVLLALLQLWFELFRPDICAKILFTDAALFAVSFVWAFLLRESKTSDKINGNSGLD